MFEPPRIFSLCHPPHLIANSNLPWWGGTNELAVPVVSSCYIFKTLQVAQVVSPVPGYCSKPASNTLHPQTDHLPLHLALNIFIHFLISSVFLIFTPYQEVVKPRKWRGSYLSLAPDHTGISEKWRPFVSSLGAIHTTCRSRSALI